MGSRNEFHELSRAHLGKIGILPIHDCVNFRTARLSPPLCIAAEILGNDVVNDLFCLVLLHAIPQEGKTGIHWLIFRIPFNIEINEFPL